MEHKRIGCLYRVSTLKQAEKNDIPMQKTACKEFIKRKRDWKLEKEYIELGVSGYKLKESERDVLQDIKKDVTNKKIDVLLVFMFDRIGRREEETPFVVQWLINQGIEVWSVKEGQRKIETRADKLINYLTYWQAGGESEKTAIRVREAQEQMAEKGILTYGGKRNAPYGYEFIKSGTYTKKGVERQKLVIVEKEADVIRKIFELYTVYGYGVGRIAKYLNNKKIKPKRGKLWGISTISSILSNPIYMGYPAYNRRTTKNAHTKRKLPFEDWILPKERIDELVIISEEVWYKTKKIKDSRNRYVKNDDDIIINKPFQTKSDLLFIGLLKCGECEYSFMTSESKKRKRNGEEVKYMYYRCSSARFSNSCNLNKKSISKEKLEKPILDTIFDFLNNIEKMDLSDEIRNNMQSNQQKEKKELRKCEEEIIEIENNINTLKQEVVKSLSGKSNFSPELLNELLEEKNNELKQILLRKSNLETILIRKDIKQKDILKVKNMIPNWKEEFENADIEMKKMLLTEFIKEIRVYNDKIEIDFLFEINDYIKNNVVINKNNEIDEANLKIIENTVLLIS